MISELSAMFAMYLFVLGAFVLGAVVLYQVFGIAVKE